VTIQSDPEIDILNFIHPFPVTKLYFSNKIYKS